LQHSQGLALPAAPAQASHSMGLSLGLYVPPVRFQKDWAAFPWVSTPPSALPQQGSEGWERGRAPWRGGQDPGRGGARAQNQHCQLSVICPFFTSSTSRYLSYPSRLPPLSAFAFLLRFLSWLRVRLYTASSLSQQHPISKNNFFKDHHILSLA
jgi:hypothetical protein